MKTFNVSVPIPPSINHCYFYIGGKKVKTKDARNYESTLADIINREMTEQRFNKFNDGKKIRCKMTFYFPDNRRRDTHNTLKLLLDVIEKCGLYSDDRYVLPYIYDWEIDRENPRVDLEFDYK